jgi:hypothetical protein
LAIGTPSDGTVTAAKMAAGAAVSNIGSGGITANELASNAVTTVKILDANITDAKIAGMAASKLSGRVPSANANSQGILQVITATATGEISTSSTSWTNTGLQVTITPSSTSSRIQIQASLNYRCDGGTNKQFAATVFRDATNLNGSEFMASALGNSVEGTAFLNIVDSPSTTSAVTYYIKFSNPDTLTCRVNPTCCSLGAKRSYMTVMEIAP